MPQPSLSTPVMCRRVLLRSMGRCGCDAVIGEMQLQDHVLLMLYEQMLSGVLHPTRLRRAGHDCTAASLVPKPAAPHPFPRFLGAVTAAPSSWETSSGLKNSLCERGEPWAGAKCKIKGAQKPFSSFKPAWCRVCPRSCWGTVAGDHRPPSLARFITLLPSPLPEWLKYKQGLFSDYLLIIFYSVPTVSGAAGAGRAMSHRARQPLGVPGSLSHQHVHGHPVTAIINAIP